METFVGIDVGKKTLEIRISSENQSYSIKNTEADCTKEAIKLQKLGVALVVMESTGGYELSMADALWNEGINLAIVNPHLCKSFADAKGRKAKTDPIDARIICEFAQALTPKVTNKPSDSQRELYAAVQRRTQLVETVVIEKTRRETARSLKSKDSIGKVISFLETEIKSLDKQIADIIDKCEEYKEKQAKLLSIKGIGKVTAAILLCFLPELGTIGKKQIASLAGLAPFNNDSGQFHGKRFIRGGRNKVRMALYMAVLSSIRSNGWLRSKYQHLLANKKEKKVAIIACMRSLIVKINAMLASGQPWIEPLGADAR